jgi:flagellar hook-associated protein 1 FlgK
VRIQNGRSAAAEASTVALTKLEQAFPITSGAPIPSSLDRLYRAFSAWAVAPSDLGSKEGVLTAVQDVADSFQDTARKLSEVAADNETAIGSVVDRINRLAGRIRSFNEQVRTGAANDAGVDAGIYATLDELSEDADIEALLQEDGTYTLLVAGEYPLVIGDKAYELEAGSSAVETHQGGRLGALLEFRDNALATQRGELDRLAAKIASRMSEFFSGTTAQTLSVTPGLQAADLDAADPPVANGKALQLAKLANPVDANDKLDGRSFTEFYGDLASDVGSKLSDAKFDKESQTQLANQVKAFREQMSGVSLDEEALHLMEFQRAYQASARMIAAIDELLEIAVNLGRS